MGKQSKIEEEKVKKTIGIKKTVKKTKKTMVEEKHKRVRVKKTTSNIKIIPSTYKSFKEGN